MRLLLDFLNEPLRVLGVESLNCMEHSAKLLVMP